MAVRKLPQPKPAKKAAPKPAAPRVPVVAATPRTPPKPAYNPNLKPGAPGGPPKSAGQLAFEAKERADKAAGRGRWAPGAALGPKLPGSEAKPYEPRARESVEAQDLPALNEISRQLAETQARNQRNIADTETRGAREQANLGELFARLQNFQGNVRSTQADNYKTLGTQAGTTYEALRNQLNTTFDSAQQKGADEANRLGLGGVTGAREALDRSNADQGYLTGRASVDQAALQGGFQQQAAGFDSLMAMMQANAQTEGYSNQARSGRETAKTISDLMFEFEQQANSLNGQRGDITATQGARTADLASALEEKSYQREAERRQQEIQNRLAQANLDLSRQNQTHQQRQDNAILRLRQAEAAASAAQAANGGFPSELEIIEVAKARAELDAIQAQGKAAVGATYDGKTGRQPVYRGQPNSAASRPSPRAAERPKPKPAPKPKPKPKPAPKKR